ncbi:hypothetical protein TNIN_148871 [Trichonephila inaurata madagascariensis]|uniref:Uncharacterized protein n=1 Tax=Trichonephila inaurata madagascariensis TaxID=2747483 RepID=A0A8X6X4H0_9ARAC|nr:hypothetical protein TNIN_148871 [Trichonephila inaurata madagascariensis]
MTSWKSTEDHRCLSTPFFGHTPTWNTKHDEKTVAPVTAEKRCVSRYFSSYLRCKFLVNDYHLMKCKTCFLKLSVFGCRVAVFYEALTAVILEHCYTTTD